MIIIVGVVRTKKSSFESSPVVVVFGKDGQVGQEQVWRVVTRGRTGQPVSSSFLILSSFFVCDMTRRPESRDPELKLASTHTLTYLGVRAPD